MSGNTMVRAPKFTASGAIAYHTPVGDNKLLEISLAPYYSSRVYFNFENSLSQKAYMTLDGNISLTLNDAVKFSIFGRNLTDSKYKLNNAQNALSLDSRIFADPRTYGVSLGYTF